MNILLVTALLLAAVSCSADNGENVSDDSSTGYRLPNNSVPISYKINLIPYIVVNNFTYDGESTIEFKILEPSSSITLHVLALTIDESATSVVSSDNTNYEIANHTYDTPKDLMTLKFATNLPIGIYTLYLKYIGNLAGDILFGFYRSSYVNDDGETVWLATTQFEPISARRAFPCWDEPALKATFIISIKHDANYTAISNMPVASQSAVDTTDNKLWTTFEETPVMSTYLVAFDVSDYGYVSNDNENFKVWARKNALNRTAYALTLGETEFKYEEEYTSIPFALPKMDQISIPDFGSDAMENWGLVAYRETVLLYEDGVTTTSRKQSIATVMSHELSHQWFGNLVSPYWWKYLWLNEGFATYFEHYFTEEVTDNWRLMEQFVIKVVQGNAFIADSAETAHPLNNDVLTIEEIITQFDDITYNKGASVVHMMSNFLSPEIMRAGLTKYLNNNAYGVVTSDDLWSALQEASDECENSQVDVSIKTIMDTWVEQAGYPVVTVTRNYATNTATISQERYFESGASDDGTRWWIPISYATQLDPDFSSTLPSEWMRQEDDSIVISGFESTDWVIFNIQQSSYYRVNYDETNWKLIADYLDSDDYVNIHVLNRAQLVYDSNHLARANRISFSIFLDITLHLQRDTDYMVWFAMVDSMYYLNRKLANTRSYPLFKRYVVNRIENCVATLGYDERDDDEHVNKFHRMNILWYACLYDSEGCRSTATAKLVAYLEDPIANPISPDLTEWTYCSGLRNANTTVWNKVLELYVQQPSTDIINYLGCSQDEDILKTYLTLATTDNTSILNDHADDAYLSVYDGNPENVNFALDYLINNFDRLYTFWNASSDTMLEIVTQLSQWLTTKEQLKKLEALVEEQRNLLGSNGTFISVTESNIQWVDVHEPVFYEWLNNFFEVEDE